MQGFIKKPIWLQICLMRDSLKPQNYRQHFERNYLWQPPFLPMPLWRAWQSLRGCRARAKQGLAVCSVCWEQGGLLSSRRPRRGRGGNIRDLCCWWKSCQGQSAPPYRLWHQIAGILVGCKHAHRVWSWLWGTCAHGSCSPCKVSEDIHRPSSSALAAGAHPRGWAPALVSAVTSCSGLFPLLYSVPMEITPTSCDPGS